MKRAMKTRLALLGCLLLGLAACSRSGAAEPSYAPGLDEIMTLTQTRHVKLWLRGCARDAAPPGRGEGFVSAFDAITQGCNGGHEATRFGFNVVTRPVGNPSANQAFRPVR